jgi:hypothetical protein
MPACLEARASVANVECGAAREQVNSWKFRVAIKL